MADPVTQAELLKLSKQPPSKVVRFFKKKGYKISWNWRDVWQDEHARAFTVAKAAHEEILQTLRRGMDQALAEGWSERRFIQELTPALKTAGWWGQRQVLNPTGNLQLVQLGSPWRLKTIYRTNMLSSFARGRYKTLAANVVNRPFWQYDAMNDSLTRQHHRELDNRVFPALHPVWERIYPPNGFNCRCMVRALTEDQVKKKGLTVEDVNIKLPKAFPDEGWNFNPAKQTVEQLAAKVKLRPYKPPPKLIPPKPVIPPPPPPAPPKPKPVPKPKPAPVPKPKPKPVPKPAPAPKPEPSGYKSLEAGGRPIKRQAWADEWHDAGTELLQGRETEGGKRYRQLIELFDHPGERTSKSGAAYYRYQKKITMGSYGPGSSKHRATWRHEYGHYLDHRIGELKLGKTGGTYRSSLPDAQKALNADMKHLNDAGRRIWKQQNPGSKVRIFDTHRIRPAWLLRHNEVINEIANSGADDITDAVAAARARLEKSDSLIARVFNDADLFDDTVFRDADPILWAEADELGDISILFSYKDPLQTIFNSRGWDWEHFSDLVGAITEERLGGWSWGSAGHGVSYYKKRKNFGVRSGQATEAFANLTEASRQRGDEFYEELIKTLFPNYVKWYDETIEEVLNL